MKMSKHVRELLLQYFPDRSRLAWEDFYCESIEKNYHNRKEQVLKCFDIMSRPWPDISWYEAEMSFSEYDASSISGSILVFDLNQKGFIHVFPSILAEISEEGFSTEAGGLAAVASNELDLSIPHEDWKMSFYLSLSEDIKKLIEYILREDVEYEAADSWLAILSPAEQGMNYRFINWQSCPKQDRSADSILPPLFPFFQGATQA
jgi:hypothetical protein